MSILCSTYSGAIKNQSPTWSVHNSESTIFFLNYINLEHVSHGYVLNIAQMIWLLLDCQVQCKHSKRELQVQVQYQPRISDKHASIRRICGCSIQTCDRYGQSLLLKPCHCPTQRSFSQPRLEDGKVMLCPLQAVGVCATCMTTTFFCFLRFSRYKINVTATTCAWSRNLSSALCPAVPAKVRQV